MTRKTTILLSATLVLFGLVACQVLAGDDEPAALQKKVAKFSAHGTLDDIAASIGDLCGLKVLVDWSAVKPAGVRQDDRVVFATSDATVEQLLEMTLARAAAKDRPLAWYIEGGVVHITTQAKVMYRHDLPEPQDAPARQGVQGSQGRPRLRAPPDQVRQHAP